MPDAFETWHEKLHPMTPYVAMLEAWEEGARRGRKEEASNFNWFYNRVRELVPKSKRQKLMRLYFEAKGRR